MRPQTLELFLTHNTDSILADIARAVVRSGTKVQREIKNLTSGKAEGELVVESREAILKLITSAEHIFRKELENIPEVFGFLLQNSNEVAHNRKEGDYLISIQALDGGDVVDSGYATGSLIGIYKQTPRDTLFSARNLVASIYIVYGTALYLGLSFGKGLHIFKQQEDGVFHIERAFVTLKGESHIAALGGFDTMAYVEGYRDLALKLSRDQFKLRYSGSLIADMHLLFMKAGGLFIHHSKKLHLLTECCPIGFLLSQSGGYSTNGVRNLMTLETTNVSETTLFLGGTKEIVDLAMNML